MALLIYKGSFHTEVIVSMLVHFVIASVILISLNALRC